MKQNPPKQFAQTAAHSLNHGEKEVLLEAENATAAKLQSLSPWLMSVTLSQAESHWPVHHSQF